MAYARRMTSSTGTDRSELPYSRRTWMTLEPIHAVVYFSPLAAEVYATVGLAGRQGYFGSRAAAMGAVSAELVRATFFNFSPDAVNEAIPAAWKNATTGQILGARHELVRKSFAQFTPEHMHTEDTVKAAALAKSAALHAAMRLDGRPLFAAHVALPWPSDDEPAMVLWHAQTLLREFRGDGHISVLVAEGLAGIDAHVTHIATGTMPVAIMRSTRAWSDDVFDAAVVDLTKRGLINCADDGTLSLTAEGLEQRARIESLTDTLAESPYLALGEADCAELRRAARPFSQALIAAGLSPLRGLPPAD
jgi:hypothetical protein